MEIYINGAGAISPQQSFGKTFLEEVTSHPGARANCTEPDYTGWIDPRAIRRMSRVIRMGVASASLALKEAGTTRPDAIITGTAYGCLEDTGIFLSKMLEQDEQALNPTPFIQSTHNTIGSQIALLLQCYGYNQTYVHRAFSFESSVLDASMMLREQQELSVLVGGVDETTDISYTILNRLGLTRNGTQIGEGAAYFLLSGQKGAGAYARLVDVDTFYSPHGESDEGITPWIGEFLKKHELAPEDIQLVLSGEKPDHTSRFGMVDPSKVGAFKHLCGEYPTASAFACWLGASILKTGNVPESVWEKRPTHPVENILIYNPYFGIHHSLILLKAC